MCAILIFDQRLPFEDCSHQLAVNAYVQYNLPQETNHIGLSTKVLAELSVLILLL